jgi:Icc protein
MGISTEQSLLDVLDHVRREQGQEALILLTGDLAQDPTPATYERLRGHINTLSSPCYCLPGNHDAPALLCENLTGGNIVCQAQILLGGWQIICLDSTIPRDARGRLAENQLALLEAKLAEQPDRHALVCLHHSPLLTGSAWLDTMTLANGTELFALLQRFPQVKAIVYGHIHQAMDVHHNGLRLLGCPSTCFQFKPGSEDFALDYVPQGYRWLDLYPDGQLETAVVRLDAVPAGLDLASGGY